MHAIWPEDPPPSLFQASVPSSPLPPWCAACRCEKVALFLLDEFDGFAGKRAKQTVLYNLLDALQTSGMLVRGSSASRCAVGLCSAG